MQNKGLQIQGNEFEGPGPIVPGSTGMKKIDSGYSKYYLGLSIALLVVLIPMLTVTYPAMVDYPGHLSRAFVLYQWKTNPSFQTTYEILLEPIPNIACDVVLVFLQRFFEIETAGKIFLCLIAVMFCLGCHLIARELMREYDRQGPPWMAVPLTLLHFNSAFLYGFINYSLGVALFMITFAWWLRSRRNWTIWGMLSTSLLILISYLTHFSAYAFLGVAVLIFSLVKLPERRFKTLIDYAPMTPPLLMYLVFMRGSGTIGALEWNTLVGKFIGLFSAIRTYSVALDAVIVGLFLIVLLFAAYRGGSEHVIRPALVLSIVFFICFLICPKKFMTSSAADMRFVMPAVLIFLFSYAPRVWGRREQLILASFILLFAARIVIITRAWRANDAEIAQAVGLVNQAPERARIYPIEPALEGSPDQVKRTVLFLHIADYAVIHRSAYIPTMFAIRGQQPLVYREKPVNTEGKTAVSLETLYQGGFEYVLTYGNDHNLAGPAIEKIGQAGESGLWKVRLPERSKADL